MGADLNNPAARLESVLLTLSGQSRDRTALTTYCMIWDLNESDRHERLIAIRRIGELAELAIEVRQRAEAVPRFGPMVLKNFNLVEEAVFNVVGLSRSHQLNHCLKPMEPTAWTSLEQLHDLLDDEHSRLELDDDAKTDLLQQITDLMAEVHDATDLDDVQRSTMLSHLARVQAALLNIDIGGPKRVEETLDGLMGGLVRLSIRTRSFAHHPIAKAALKLIASIAMVLGVVADWTALTAAGITTLMLERGGDGGGGGGGGSD